MKLKIKFINYNEIQNSDFNITFYFYNHKNQKRIVRLFNDLHCEII